MEQKLVVVVSSGLTVVKLRNVLMLRVAYTIPTSSIEA